MKKECKHNSTCKFLFEKHHYKIFECEKCGLRFAQIDVKENHVDTVYSDEYFFEGKAGYPNYLKEKKILLNYGKWYANLISKYKTPGKVLDTGCAAGFILKGFVDSGWHGTGIEPNNKMAEYGRKKLNLNIETGSLETFKTNEKYDLINMIQVIGHFYSLDEVILKVKAILNKDGMVLVESWNIKSGYAKFMGKNWHEYSPPSVIRWFSDKTLCNLFEQYGFILVTKGFPPKKINASHALSLIEEKSFRFPSKKRIFRFLDLAIGKINIRYPLHDLKWYLFQLKDTVNK